ncbi:MAG TPA: hypothetical protein ENK66_07870 [Arcobacter sp.]|jgi:hypothetical protein|nr:hypothetical protein [Arcobacter sp.]
MQKEQQIEVRKIGLKTYIYMGIIVLLGIVFFLLAQNGKAMKAKEILKTLGYTNVQNVQVYSIKDFENVDTKIQGKQYSIRFNNLNTSETCKGFIIKDFKHNVDQDLICTKDKR